MSGGSRIIAFGSSGDGPTDANNGADGSETGPGDEPLDLSSWVEEEPETGETGYEETAYETETSALGQRLAVASALLAIAGWTAFYVWANRAVANLDTPPAGWASVIAIWTLPVMLVALVWLIAMRSSTREAARFADAARSLSHESALLETRLLTVNRELSLAREFIAAQSRDLEALGRIASERLSANADRLQALVAENGSRVETIGNVSEAALANMEKLRGQLPVIASSAKDITNNIANAGRTAHTQIEEMVRGFNRLNDFGKASEAQVFMLRDHVNETLAGLAEQCEQLENVAAARFAELSARGEEFRTRLDRHEVDALASIRTRADALSAELETARGIALDAERECLDALALRIAELGEKGTEVAGTLREEQDRAQNAWRESMYLLESERSALFSRIEQADEDAAERASARLAAIDAEVQLIEETLSERGERISAETQRHRETIEAAQEGLVARLGAMMSQMDREIEERSLVHARLADETAGRAQELSERFAVSQAGFEQIARDAGSWESRVGEALSRLAGQMSETHARLGETEGRLGALTESGLRLFELVHASAEQAGEALPRAFEHSDTALSGLEQRTTALFEALQGFGTHSDALSGQIDASNGSLESLVARIEATQDQLRDRAAEHLQTLQDLSRSLEQIDERNDLVAGKARGQLTEAIGEMEGAARRTLSLIDTEGAAAIERISREMESRSADSVGRAIHNAVAEISGQLEQAASHAAGVSREATIQLRDQLGKVHELVANLENRVARARERAEEQVDNDFARRAALITESLNSNAIDIAKALSTDVADTAWQGYLRGDRGIFTRRAVSLIDNNDSRSIQQIFERDSDFREHVSRYIHDFEAMLRQILSTRDGTALGVTLLSSDMGKLYVALAQAIERLRT